MFEYFYGTYSRIMRQETELIQKPWDVPIPEEMYGTATQVLEVAKSELVLRYWNVSYGLVDKSLAPTPKDAITAARESVGAHTFLMLAIVYHALNYIYGPDWLRTEDGYTFLHIFAAIMRHDLPENLKGDTADDGNRDEAAKIAAEHKYQKWYSKLSPSREAKSNKKVQHLLTEMENKSSPTGKLLYVADKIAAVIITLCCDQANIPPLRRLSDPEITERDRREILICDYSEDGAYFASEMWTIDYLKAREIIQYDDSGFCTALVVMVTLIVNQCWYNWRKQDYKLS